AWDLEDCDGFDVCWSRTSGDLTNIVDAGFTNVVTIRIAPPPKTNTVITVTGDALQGASDCTVGLWVDLKTNYWCQTNPALGMLFRSAGTNPATITATHY